jgi:hypothetical protein
MSEYWFASALAGEADGAQRRRVRGARGSAQKTP